MKKIEQQVLKFIDENRLIAAGDSILVALSGGADSVFLLSILAKFKNRFKIEIGAVHVNHKLRKITADEDEKYCSELCTSLNIPFFSVSKDVKSYAVKNKMSVEEAARIVRYSVFNTITQKYSFNKIATAHNIGDNTETVLLNLIKGTGLKGIAGIPVIRGNIIRPLLSTSKEDIVNYLNSEGIYFRVDESNLENDYERNYLRNEIIPLIEKRFGKGVSGNVFRSASIYRNYIDAFTQEAEKYTVSCVKFSGSVLELFLDKIGNRFFINDVISAALRRYFSYNCSYEDIKKIAELAEKKNNSVIELKDSLTALKEAGILYIKRRGETSDFKEKTISVGEKICINDKEDVYISLTDKKNIIFTGNRKEEYISGDKLTSDFVIRRWRAGDKFRPLGLKGVKKVSDFLNDEKIPGSRKAEQLVLTQNDKIIWVIGLRIDDRFKLNENTKKVLKICLK